MPQPLTASRLSTSRTTTDQLWAYAAMGLAAVGIVLAIAGIYDVGAFVSFLAVVAGGWAMYVSENRAERFETVTATVAAAVALAACLAFGSGLSV